MIKALQTVTLITLACGGISIMGSTAISPAADTPPLTPPSQESNAQPPAPQAPPPQDLTNAPAAKAEEKEAPSPTMAPFGLVHDFGKVPSGIVKHAFRIFNTSDVPLQVPSVRWSSGNVVAHATKLVLQPHEEGDVEVTVDARRFRGRRSFTVYLQTDNGTAMTTLLQVTADSPGWQEK